MKKQTQSDVIVIGAGISGLHAAMLLESQGATVTVLEGQSRVGGRLLSLKHLDGAPEAGGDSILGGYGRVRDVSAKLGLKLVDFQNKRERIAPEIAIGGELISRAAWPTHRLNKLPKAYKHLFPGRRSFEQVIDAQNPLRSAGDWIDPQNTSRDESVYSFLRRGGWSDEAIEQNYETNIGRGTSAHDCSVLTWYFRRAWDRIQTDIEKVALKVSGGNQLLPEAMAKTLGDAVHLNTRVSGVTQTPAGIEISTDDAVRYRAQFAICATPLPPLRWVRFDPLLPNQIAEAIRVLPSMQITKIFLTAKSNFWDNDGLSPAMWTDTAAGEISALQQTESGDQITGLVARIRGFDSQRLDALGPKAASELVIREIQKIRPSSKGLLTAVGYKSWAADPFAGGTWTEWEPGQIHRYIHHLLEPVGRLHFAGEHASLANRGMEAAMESGERAALEILQRL